MTVTDVEVSEPARENLLRSVPFDLVRDEGDGDSDGLTFRGYAAVFNEPTVIDSWEGRFEEEIAPGAFRKSLRERTPVFQFDHGQHPMVGSIPLGSISEAREDDHGVYVEARLHDNWLTQPVRDAIESGSISGMSYRFEVVRDEWRTPDGKLLRDPAAIMEGISSPAADGLLRRTVRELKSRELGPVVFPAYQGTTAAVRSVTLDLARLDDPEQRRTLAQAVLMADTGEQPPDLPEPPEDTSDEAVDHGDRDDDTPQTTSTAGEHESQAEPQGVRPSDIQRWREQHSLPTLKYSLPKGAP